MYNYEKLNIQGLKGAALTREVGLYAAKKIITLLESDSPAKPWQKSWAGYSGFDGSSYGHCNQDGKVYRGWNQFSLAMDKMALGYDSNTWGTKKNWFKKGYLIAENSPAVPIIFAKKTSYKTIDDDGEEVIKTGGFIYNISFVYNSECTLKKDTQEPFEPYESEEPSEPKKPFEIHEACEALVNNYLKNAGIGLIAAPANSKYQAYYAPHKDIIAMPPRESFIDTKDGASAKDNWYATLFHEMVHSTGHKDRLNRLKGARFGSKDYAFEELVAEFGAVMVCGAAGLFVSPPANHHSYIASWKEKLTNDPTAAFRAVALAQSAMDYIAVTAAGETYSKPNYDEAAA
jgi:antirestriction protein ArdC